MQRIARMGPFKTMYVWLLVACSDHAAAYVMLSFPQSIDQTIQNFSKRDTFVITGGMV